MINGLIIGGLLGSLGLFWIIYGEVNQRWLLTIILVIISFLIPTYIGAEIGKYEDKNIYLQYIESYKIEKETIEEEIKNKTFEELEKMGIFSSIIYKNSELIKEKVRYKKWYYYYLDYSLIDNLKPIEIGE